MRRAIQQGRVLGLESPWLHRFAERTIEILGDVYSELVDGRDTIEQWVRDEEESFGRTLERGTELLERLIAEAEESGTSWIDAADAFKLHDTYGFPYDLTKELLAEKGLAVDDQGFEELMEQQRTRARMGVADAHGSEDRHGKVLGFASSAPATRFVGYERLRATTGVSAASSENGHGLVKLEESPFYAEGGGQVADSGRLVWDGGEAGVADVYRIGEDQALEVRDGGFPSPASGSRRSSIRICATRRCATTPRPICCTRRCGSGSAPTSARPARRCGPTSCASTSPTGTPSLRRSCATSRTSSTNG